MSCTISNSEKAFKPSPEKAQCFSAKVLLSGYLSAQHELRPSIVRKFHRHPESIFVAAIMAVFRAVFVMDIVRSANLDFDPVNRD